MWSRNFSGSESYPMQCAWEISGFHNHAEKLSSGLCSTTQRQECLGGNFRGYLRKSPLSSFLQPHYKTQRWRLQSIKRPQKGKESGWPFLIAVPHHNRWPPRKLGQPSRFHNSSIVVNLQIRGGESVNRAPCSGIHSQGPFLTARGTYLWLASWFKEVCYGFSHGRFLFQKPSMT